MLYTEVMTNKKNEDFHGERGLIAKVSDEFREEFQQQLKERGQKQKDAMISAIRLWMGLPAEVQAKIINQTTSEDILKITVREIIQEQLAAFRLALTPEQQKIVDRKLEETKKEIHRER